MPELPEVETTLRGIAPHLLHQRILHIEVANPKLRYPVPEQLSQLRDTPVTNIQRRAKYLVLTLKHQQHLILHLGMSGSLRLADTSEPPRKHDHLTFYLDSGLQLRFHDPRRFGCCLLHEGDPADHPLLAKLGPEPLSDTFSADYLYQSTRGKHKAIKLHIMDNATVVGVGNIYACESLFYAGIHPKRPAANISKKRLTALHTTIRETLAHAIEQGGTTLRDFLHTDGSPGYFKQQLMVYGREKAPCKACNTPIRNITLGQRSTFYCPNCQR